MKFWASGALVLSTVTPRTEILGLTQTADWGKLLEALRAKRELPPVHLRGDPSLSSQRSVSPCVIRKGKEEGDQDAVDET